MKKYFFSTIVLFILFTGSVECRQPENIILGKTIKIFSKILKEDRPIQIYVPQDHTKGSSCYPVLVTLDGERFFSSTAATVQFLAKYGHIPSMIVVGIPNTNRGRDFSFEKTGVNSKSGAEHFLQFLEKELMPYINNNYRTCPYRIIKGWCATGAFCIYTLFTHPALFNAYFASSPYLVDEASFIFELVNEYHSLNIKNSKFLYLSVGGRDRPDAKVKVPEFIELLKKKHFKYLNLHYSYFQNEDHYTIDFQTLYRAFEELYSEFINVKKIVKDGYGAGRKRLKLLAKKFGFKEMFPERTLARMGYVLLNQELFQYSITLFKIVADYYPESYLTYENLGEAYMLYGKNNLAIKNFKKSLKLYPANKYAKDMLIKLIKIIK